jgi:AcrR family transcriptional regulator
MPYTSQHKQMTRAKIVEAARKLFNRHGFETVSIDQIMEAAGLTRGGFYNHFKTKDALYAEAVSSFLMGRGAEWRADAGVNPHAPSSDMVMNMVKSYLSDEHLDDIEGQCPMIALPSDVARANDSVREAYQGLLESMVWLFDRCIDGDEQASRQQALVLAALCIGGMTLARALPECSLAHEIRDAALENANRVAAG